MYRVRLPISPFCGPCGCMSINRKKEDHMITIDLDLKAAFDAFADMIEDAFADISKDAVSPLYGGMVIDTTDIPPGVSLIPFFEKKGWAHLPLEGEEESFEWISGFMVRWGEGKINPTPLVLA